MQEEDINNGEHFMKYAKQLQGKASQKRECVIWLTIYWCVRIKRNNIIFIRAIGNVCGIEFDINIILWLWSVIGSNGKQKCNFYNSSKCPLDFLKII